MTKIVETPLTRLLANGATVSFAPGFELFELTDLVVDLADTEDIPVTIVLNGPGTYDYIVSAFVLDNSTNRYTNVFIQFNNAPPSGYHVGFARAGVQSQTLDLTAGGNLPAESLERRFDRIVALVQDLQAQLNRALLAPIATDAYLDANNRALRNLADPIDGTDAVTKNFLAAGVLTVDVIDGVTVNSIAALKALPVGGAEAATAFVTGYVTRGDGGGGLYYYDATWAGVDDGVTCITPSGGVGRWRLNPNGWITARQAGTLSSGVTTLVALNVANTAINVIVCDPDGATTLGYAGSTKLTTQTDGIAVQGIARASGAATASGDLLRKGEFDSSQTTQDNSLTSGLAGKAALVHTHPATDITAFPKAGGKITGTTGAFTGNGATCVRGSAGNYTLTRVGGAAWVSAAASTVVQTGQVQVVSVSASSIVLRTCNIGSVATPADFDCYVVALG